MAVEVLYSQVYNNYVTNYVTNEQSKIVLLIYSTRLFEQELN